jgi:hypothetical protein
MRSLRLVVPAALVILSLSFAPAQAATGDDPGGEGFLSQLFSSLTGSADEPTDPGTGNIVDPPATQPVDPPPNNDVTPPVLPSEIPNIVNPPAGDPTDPSEDNTDTPLTTEPSLEPPKPIEGDPDGPTANDDQYEVEENSGATTMSVTSNDDGNITAVQAVTQPSNGELDQTEMTTFQYTPNPDFVGTDSFTYQAKGINQAASNSATVTINVAPQGVGADRGDGDRQSNVGTIDECQDDDPVTYTESGDGCCYASDGEVNRSGDGCHDPCFNDDDEVNHSGNSDGCYDGCYDPDGDMTYSSGKHDGCYDGCRDHDDGYSESEGCEKHDRHKKFRHHHHDHDDDICRDDDVHERKHWKHHGKKHHGDHEGDRWDGDGDMSSSHGGDEWNGDENWHGDNEWNKWKKDWNHDWDDDDREHCDEDDDGEGGDLPDTGSPVNLSVLALSGLLVIAGLTVVRRTRA